MLKAETVDIIKSTVPVLEVHGKAITTRFYELLFSNHPELLNIFNHANQKQGRQQTALANAVYAAAANIDRLEAIIPEVKLIAEKHRSLGIKPEHYPIVGKNLLAAIKDVLGDAATDEVIGAWAEAYGVIAHAFISVEQELYQQVENQDGGWGDFREFVVDMKVKESDVITSFYLKPKNGKGLAQYKPGQYISVKVEIPGQKYKQIRQYSLSDAPGKDYYRISVKREDAVEDRPEGLVTNFLHKHVQEGDVLPISAPAGVFTLDTDTNLPVVFISGGVGVTPLMSMLNTLVEAKSNRTITFIQATQNSSVHAFRSHLVQLAAQHLNVSSYVCYNRPNADDQKGIDFDQNFVSIDFLKTILPNNKADFYFCGPLPFMKGLYSTLKDWGVPAENIHFEFFGPAAEMEEEETTLQSV